MNKAFVQALKINICYVIKNGQTDQELLNISTFHSKVENQVMYKLRLSFHYK